DNSSKDDASRRQIRPQVLARSSAFCRRIYIVSPRGPEILLDEGYDWVVVACSFFLQMFGMGIANGFGSYQAYYLNKFSIMPASTITWIGTMISICLLGGSYFSGVFVDRFGPRLSGYIGAVTNCLALMLASLAKEPWQLILSQDVM
ncbi:hypothetical protein EV182_004795, partial [Spiromyces aspiralis]